MMSKAELPWNERVVMLSLHPDAASRSDIARLASELVDLENKVAKIRYVAEMILSDGYQPDHDCLWRQWACGVLGEMKT